MPNSKNSNAQIRIHELFPDTVDLKTANSSWSVRLNEDGSLSISNLGPAEGRMLVGDYQAGAGITVTTNLILKKES